MKSSFGYRQIRDEVARALDGFHAHVMRASGRSIDEIRVELYPIDSATLGAAKVKRLLRRRPDLSLRALMTVHAAIGMSTNITVQPMMVANKKKEKR